MRYCDVLDHVCDVIMSYVLHIMPFAYCSLYVFDVTCNVFDVLHHAFGVLCHVCGDLCLVINVSI